MHTLILGMAVFFARICDVTVGTLRTINIIQGRTKVAFVLGFFEVSMWLMVLSAILDKIMETPVLGLFYAFGFSTGNVVGILVERKLALGISVLRVISNENGKLMATRIREAGYAVTTFTGEGMKSPVLLLYIVAPRKKLKSLIAIVNEIEPDAFYMTEQAGSVSKILRPEGVPPTGWRAVFKKK